MCDVSDGLVADLSHICDASRCAATISMADLPLSTAALTILLEEWVDPAALATGGDDYELLFTAPPTASALIESLATELALKITQIGTIEEGAGVRLVDVAGNPIPVATAGYRHF